MGSKSVQGLVSYFVALWSYRYFWFNLVKAELQRRYRRSVLGLGWSLLQPLSMTVVLGVVYGRLFKISFWDFAPTLLCGLAFWNMFSQSVLRGCDSLVASEAYIRQKPLPLAMFPLRTVLTIGFHFLISVALTMVLVWPVKGIFSPLALLSLIPILFLLFVLSWSLAILAGFSHTYFPDTQHLAEVSLQVLMFMTPIMYPARLLQENGLKWLIDFNPLALLVEMLRDAAIHGQAPSLTTFAIASGLIALPAVASIYVVRRLEDRVVFAL